MLFRYWYERDRLDDDDEDLSMVVGVLNVLAGDGHGVAHSSACDAVLDGDESRLEEILATLGADVGVEELLERAESKSTSLSLTSMTRYIGSSEDGMRLDRRTTLSIGRKKVCLGFDDTLSLQPTQPYSFTLRDNGKRICKSQVAEGRLAFKAAAFLDIVKRWLSSISGVGLQVLGFGGNISWQSGRKAILDKAPNMILSAAFNAEAACWLLHHLMVGSIRAARDRTCFLVGLGRERRWLGDHCLPS